LAHAAAKAVAREPGRSYNPLFIYGGVGLGKTHLLQAVGNRVKQENPNARILYVSCEKFTSDFIKAITNRKIDQFKQTYRTVDLLLIDDVQFLAGKESTQEEFFHTFNELHQNNRQLIVTSDRPPKAIPELESRLLSRFEWGMIADVSPVDYETRVAIIETKCIEKGLKLDKEMIDYIAKAIHNNVREMEGALNRIKAHIELQNIHVDLDTIKNILATFVTLPRTDSLTPQVIIKKVAKYYDITLEELMGKGRARRLVYPRQLAMYLMREELQSSYPSIGKEMGGRDHTTAMHACQKITKELEKDEKVRQDYQLIKQRLFQ
jgi:chromosomal replication initiator protein